MTAAGVLLQAAFSIGPAYWFNGRNTSERTTDPTHLLAIVLLLITGIVHLYIYIASGETIMLFAGLGFLAGVGLFVVGFAQRYLYLIGIVYTLAQLVLWVQAGMPHLGSYGLADKVVPCAGLAVVVVALFTLLGILPAGAGTGLRELRAVVGACAMSRTCSEAMSAPSLTLPPTQT